MRALGLRPAPGRLPPLLVPSLAIEFSKNVWVNPPFEFEFLHVKGAARSS